MISSYVKYRKTIYTNLTANSLREEVFKIDKSNIDMDASISIINKVTSIPKQA